MDPMTTKTDVDQMVAKQKRNNVMWASIIILFILSLVALLAWSASNRAYNKGTAEYERSDTARQTECTPLQNEYVKTLVASCVSHMELEYCFGDGKSIIILEVCKQP